MALRHMGLSSSQVSSRVCSLGLLNSYFFVVSVRRWCSWDKSFYVPIRQRIGTSSLPIRQRGPEAAHYIMPNAVQRYIELCQMPPRSKGPGTSTVPFLAACPVGQAVWHAPPLSREEKIPPRPPKKQRQRLI